MRYDKRMCVWGVCITGHLIQLGKVSLSLVAFEMREELGRGPGGERGACPVLFSAGEREQ